MNNTTDITTLGKDYTLTDTSGKIIKQMQIIQHTEILDAALGEYNNTFSDMEDYLNKSISVLSGYKQINQYRVMWYSTTDEDVNLSDVIRQAMQNGYDKIIIEKIVE